MLWALWRHFQRFRDMEFIKPHFGEQDLAATYRRTAAEVRAGTEAHLWAPALDILNWAAAHALPSGVMAEQVHPYTNAPLSVSPLTWSHATLVMTVREYMARQVAISEHP